MKKMSHVSLVWMIGLAAGVAARAAVSISTIGGVPPGASDGAGLAARFHWPAGLVSDAAGNIFVADNGSLTIRKITAAGVVSTFAGTAGLAGTNDGVGAAARFRRPQGVARDGSGNFYVADSGSHTIRKITAAGVVSTFAGTAGLAGTNDGVGAAARFDSPTALCVVSNKLYVADTGNQTIRRIEIVNSRFTPIGTVETFAGTPGRDAVINGPVASACFAYPEGLAADKLGNLYVSDTFSNTLRKISGGVVTTVAGTVSRLGGSADGTGTNAQFSIPLGLAVDAANNLFIADEGNSAVRKMTGAAVVTTFVGSKGQWGTTDGTGVAALFDGPREMTFDPSGNLFVSDGTTIRKITPAGAVTTFAGFASGGTNDGSKVTRFLRPYAVAVDKLNNRYVADTDNHTIRKITPAGVVTTFAGAPRQSGSADGTGSVARFSFPAGLAVDSSNNVFVADSSNHTIRKITPAGIVTTLAGGPGTNGLLNGSGSAARFSYPAGLAIDASNVIYVADSWNNMIRRVTPAGLVSTHAGGTGRGTNDGSWITAQFDYPQAVAVDAAFHVYVADSGNSTIRKIAYPAGTVSTLAGQPGVSGHVDGPGATAMLVDPNGLAVNAAGQVFVGDGPILRQVTPAGLVTTLAGVEQSAGSLDGIGSAARFDGAHGLALDTNGWLIVADTFNNAIRQGVFMFGKLFFDTPAGDLANWWLDTNGVHQAGQYLGNTGVWRFKTAGDLDGDGVADLFFQTAAGNLACWLMNEDGSVRGSLPLSPAAGWELKACACYNGPGTATLFFQQPAGPVALWMCNTNGAVISAVPLGNMGEWKLKGAGDLDGDHLAEVFWAKADGTLAVWYHLPTGGIRSTLVTHPPSVWALSGIVDIDGDGTSDLAWQTTDGNVAWWMLATGTTNGTPRATSAMGSAAGWQLRAGGR